MKILRWYILVRDTRSPVAFVVLTSYTVKAQELEALADAVRSENYRVYALQAQAQSVPSHFLMN